MPEGLIPSLGFGVIPSSMQWIWIVDCSDSMRMNRRIDALNTAIKTAIPEIRKIAEENGTFNMFMRVLKFSTGAEWVTNENVRISDFEWIDLEGGEGATDLGEAFILLSKAMKSKKEGGLMTDRAKKPYLVLITDGYPTDDWESGLKILMQEPWAQRARRIAIGLQGADHEVLKAFIGDRFDKDECLVMVSEDNYEAMAKYLVNLYFNQFISDTMIISS